VSTRLSSGTVKTTCTEIITIINGMVIDNKINGAVTGSHGLAIYLPASSETNATDLGEYAKLACNSVRASGSGTWGAYINYLLSGAGGTVTYGKGGFGIYLSWEKPDGSACDADIDLYIWEPAADFATTGKGQWYAPYMGQTSPNGFFSQDSADSGKSHEYYLANNQVYKGNYYFLANYFLKGLNCSSARAHFELYDPDTKKWFEMTSANVGFSMLYPSPRLMSLDNTYTSGCGNLLCLNNYSDWWVPDVYWGARDVGAGAAMMNQSPPIVDKESQIIFRYRKEMRFIPNMK
jgi:hypothetical protein